MIGLLKKLVKDEGGQDLGEYGIALAVIAVAVGGIAVAIAGDVNALWTQAQTAIHSALGA
jgi:Flp pilus assembly pilin Flp